MVHQLGYSLVRGSENFFGRLRPSQMHGLFEGWNKHEKKKADATKKASKGGGRQSAGMGDLSRIPGVKMKRRAKK